MIVVDTNIIAFALIDGEHTDQARTLWQADPQWRVPRFWRYEFSNVLTTYTRNGGMEPEQATRLWAASCQWCGPFERSVDMAAVLQLAIARNISAYDAQFVGLAVSLGVPLVSEDAPLRRRCPGNVLTMSDFLGR